MRGYYQRTAEEYRVRARGELRALERKGVATAKHSDNTAPPFRQCPEVAISLRLTRQGSVTGSGTSRPAASS